MARSQRTAFVLAGGGSLGTVQVGMLYALLEAGLRPDLLVGSSLGAFNGAWVAGQASLDGVEEAPLPIFPLATDLAGGEAVVLTEGDVVPALMASAAIPGVFPPVEIDGRFLIDGSVVADASLSQAVALGATTIYFLPAASLGDTTSPRGALDVAARAAFLTANRMATTMATTLSSTVDVHVVPPSTGARNSMFDLGSTTDLIHHGYLQARAWLEDRPSALAA